MFFFLFFPVYSAKSTRYYLLENNIELAFIWGLSIGELFGNLFLCSSFLVEYNSKYIATEN